MRKLKASMHVRLLCIAMLSGACASLAAEQLVQIRSNIFEGAKFEAGKLNFEFDLGTERKNWNHAKWSIHKFETPRDLSTFDAVRLKIATQQPRGDTGVFIGLQESDGTWYVLGPAANLTLNENEGVARFRDFYLAEWYTPDGNIKNQHDENGLFDTHAIQAVALGCVNPLGIGVVSFSLQELSVVKLDLPVPQPVKIEVYEDLLNANGQTFIPAGLFGVYQRNNNDGRIEKYRLALNRSLHAPAKATPLTPIQIGCFGERTTPSPYLNEGWEAAMKKSAEEMVARAKSYQQKLYMEFWNEPYLNWANYTRKNLHPDQYDMSRAVEGGPVHLKYKDEVVPYLRWTKDYDKQPYKWCSRIEWRRAVDAKGNWVPNMYGMAPPWNQNGRKAWREAPWPPEEVKEGETFTVKRTVSERDPNTKQNVQVEKEFTYTAITPWHIYDETQHSYWSGRGMLKLYIEPMLAFGRAMKAADLDSIYFIGWGFRPSEDHWAGWDKLYKDTIDAGIEVADGIHEHDYGGDPLKLPANYEVVYSYAKNKYNKALLFVNTEQAAQTDPQAYPAAEKLSQEGASDLNKYRWAARKMMRALTACPEKAFGYCYFGDWFSNHGEGLMFEQLINMRGKLVHLTCSDPNIFAVAAIDGTDPASPRPADLLPQRNELVVAVWNDDTTSRKCELNIVVPKGAQFSGEVIAKTIAIDEETKRPKVVSNATTTTTKAAHRLAAEIPPYQMLVLTLPLTGSVPENATIQQRQYLGKTTLQQVTFDKPLNETIELDATALSKAKRAWLKFVAERLDHDEGQLVLNDKPLTLPSAITNENAPLIRELPLDLADLKATNQLTFKVSTQAHAGYLLGMNSIMLEYAE